jgi:ATP-binding cassette subfamily F protein 3
LILDEPTNHLDIDSRRALLDALNDYEGAVVLITHDRSLMELVADRLWLAADGTIKPFGGDMDDYAKFVLERARINARNPVSAAATPEPEPEAVARDAGPSVSTLRRRLEETEAAMAKATAVVAGLDVELADPDVYVSSPARAAALGSRRVKAQATLDAAEAKWLEAAEKLEAAMVKA